MQCSVRGATTCENTKKSIFTASREMLERIMQRNNIAIGDIASAVFTCTRDLTAAYPAAAARELGITAAGLLCVQEMHVDGSLERCVRVLVLFNSELKQNEVRHVYLNGAQVLRPDLVE